MKHRTAEVLGTILALLHSVSPGKGLAPSAGLWLLHKVTQHAVRQKKRRQLLDLPRRGCMTRCQACTATMRQALLHLREP